MRVPGQARACHRRDRRRHRRQRDGRQRDGLGSATAATGCDGVRDHVKQLYTAELANAGLVDDNTAMVMKDCAKQPDRIAACAAAATSVAKLEHDCLIPLDAEGTEGDQLKR